MSELATCGLCDGRLPLEEILEHLRVEHELDVEPATWPDGELVVVDATLEPADFEERAP